MVIFQIPGVASYSFVIRQISTNSGVVCAAVRCESFSALAHTYPDIFEKRNLFPSFCTERFSMISLFASNIICSFQIFALTLFIVIHWLNLHKEVLAAQKDSCHFYYPLFHLLCVRQVIITKKSQQCSLTNKSDCSFSFPLYPFYVNVDSWKNILHFLIMVYLTLVYFSWFYYRTTFIHSNAFRAGVSRFNCDLVIFICENIFH